VNPLTDITCVRQVSRRQGNTRVSVDEMQGQRSGLKVGFSPGSPKKSESPLAHGSGDESLNPYFPSKEGVKQQGILNRTLNTLNLFKVRQASLAESKQAFGYDSDETSVT
jgi:hypothetical protein